MHPWLQLLNDDLHVLCPFAYAIRIQHLDERYKQLKITEVGRPKGVRVSDTLSGSPVCVWM